MRPEQVAYWENVFRQLLESPEWKAEMTRVNGTTDFMPAARFRKYIDEDYAPVEAFLVDLGLATRQR
jgi:tripartite-type tricarboxylate transporter receptor subunit TctC